MAPDTCPPGAASEGIMILFVNGVLGDKSFFDSAQRGVQRAPSTNLASRPRRSRSHLIRPAGRPALVDVPANEEFDVMVLVGTFQTMVEYLQKDAPQYPDKKLYLL